MHIKIALIFILSILIPTTLLAYFGLQAVKSEKSIVEKNMKRRYDVMAEIIHGEIETVLHEAPQGSFTNPAAMEGVIAKAASIFKDQVTIFDKDGRVVGGEIKDKSEKPMLTRTLLKNLPYTIAVYERYPLLLKGLEEKKKGLSLYVMIIGFSALSILLGGFFTLWALSREWQLAYLKSEFVASLSHDLRRPLTSIRMFSEMLKDNRVPTEEKKLEYYSIISNESEKLTNLANNILDFSRIESGRKKYDFKYDDIARVVTETVERFKAYMMHKSCVVSLHIDRDISRVKIDPNAVSQALINLLTNAFKFSPFDKEIKVNVVKKDKAVAIEVVDEGIGISRDEQKKIFRKFYRGSYKEGMEKEGAGLGLALVKHTAEAHGGRVELVSEVGKGSKFTLVLPV